MKLAKKISEGIALCAALAIMGTMGGVITSCSNGSEDTDSETPPADEGVEKTISKVDEVSFTVTTASVGGENTNIVFTYDRSANGAKEKIKITGCDIEVLVNDTKKATITELDFALNVYDDFTENTATEYLYKKSIGTKVVPNDVVKVVFKSKTGKVSGEGVDSAQIEKLEVSLIDNDENAGWYKQLAEKENENQPLFPAEDEPPVENPPEEEEPEETLIYKLDFSGEKLPENDYDGIKDSNGAVEFKVKEGLSITGGWKSFGIVPKGITEKDFSTANYVKVTFKCSDDATFEKDNNRLMVAVYNTDATYADTNFSWTAFFDKGTDDIPTKFETVEKEIKWEQKDPEKLPFADTSSINGIRIWTQAFTGTVTIQSIEFIKK